ncbi:hypothetical protein BDU57DRAFT_514115 [Ampelomyces quisqualis]|uniref:AMP-activated protein kinase glycogen-binding domain-containing protein n=1 Tax=Ampelomyces quisqualis TaxID=50730 RepID=A0A6A5QT28_AMPQU|nr:hypothetical protein BDU57DRAFT_514115 [Ampelomyces quisqualis]
MGKYTFSWEHAANDVLVTGTFDDWQKTVTLDKVDGVFKKTVELPKVHTQYKFVVDGNWVINESARKEDGGDGIVNNVLLPDDIVDEPVGTLSSAAPQATTAALAGAVPKESDKTESADALPGAFPETPAAETPLGEAQTFHVAPIPATHELGNPIKLAPGDKVPHPSTFTSNTVSGTANTDAASYAQSDALPKLPDLCLTPQAERDAKGGMFSLPPVSGNMVPESSLPMGVDAVTEKDTGVTIQSAAPTSTTAALAGAVPKEPRGVPGIVSDSRKEAGFPPEATSNPIAVLDKKEVEQELKDEVPEAPANADNSYTSQISSSAGAAAATVTAAAAAGAGLFTAAAYNAKEKAAEAAGLDGAATSNTTTDVPSIVSDSQKAAHTSPEASANAEAVREKSQVEQELLSEIPKTTETGTSAPAIAIPAVVSESQKQAHASPEAAANSEAVVEKKAVESELLEEIPKTNEAGEPAPVLSAATAATAPAATTQEPAANIPDVVAESQKAAHVSPEAAVSTEVVGENKAVEAELLEEVKKVNSTGEPAPVIAGASSANPTALSDEAIVDSKPLNSSSEPDALNAPASKPATTAQPTPFNAIDADTNVSYVPKEPAQEPSTTEQTKPTVTTGTETTTTEVKSGPTAAATTEASSSLAPETPKKDLRKDSDVSPKGTPGSQSLASAADDKKKKRRSIFGKIKDKLSSMH